MTKSDLDKYLLENHLRTCDKCRQEMAELTAQAQRAVMPEMEEE